MHTTAAVRRALSTLPLLLLALLLAACGAAPAAAPTAAPAAETGSGGEVTVTPPQGETTVALNPQRVVVFDYSALDTLDQLGIPVIGVPQASLPPALAKYRSDEYANVGTLFEPDYELVNSLKPDLIVAGGRSAAVYPQLAEIAPTIDVTVDNANFLESYKAANLMLGKIFGKEAEVERRLAAIEESIATLRSVSEESGYTGLILLTTGGKVNAYGPGSRFGLIHDLMGVRPATDADAIAAATHGDAVSFEFIQETNPDILFVIDRDAAIGEDGEAAAQLLNNELVASTSAWSSGRVIYLDGGNWYLAPNGLGTFASMIDEVASAFE